MFEERHSLCSKKDIPCVQKKKNIPCARSKTFLAIEERHSLCLRKDIPCVRRKTLLVFEDDKTPIFGRTDLRKGVSEAKFDAEADFNVKKCLAPPKSPGNHEKPKNKSRKIFRQKNSGVKKSKVANRPKRVFPKFRADRSQVRGANEPSKFEILDNCWKRP